jgi:NADH-quinone oxidoreductase subunit G
MTVTAGTGAEVQKRDDLVTVTIDGFELQVPKGTLVIRAAELIGIQVPRFCDHPLLDPVGACRQCLVEVQGQPKPLASCTTTVTDGMVVKTQLTSPVADKAQQGVMEMLLINHPLDCPVCDKGGECPLQNQAMSNGRAESRFEGVKRTFPKPINISSQVLLDRERCVLCARCTRFSQQVAGDPFIEMLERGALQQVGIYEAEPFQSYFSGNTVQICPVGALTGAAYRFRSRPFDLVSSPSIADHDACGSAIRVDHRRGKVMRRLSGDDPEVNEEWITDKDRFSHRYADLDDRLRYPMVRDADTGELRAASWPEAFVVAARGLASARSAGGVGVLTGGRVPAEDAYAYSKFARVALGTNDIDFRARAHSAEEAEFLAAHVALTGPGAGGVTYAELETARSVVLVGFEPEDEAGTVFLRLRKAARGRKLPIYSIAPFTSRGLHKMSGTLIATRPGDEPATIESLAHDGSVAIDSGGVILVGERLAEVPGALSAVSRLAMTTGARLVWIPRRAGDRGAVEAGALPTLLPGGRPVSDASARVDLATAWGVEHLPDAAGRDGNAIVAAAAAGELGGLVIGGVDPADLPDPELARRAIDRAGFVVALEMRESEVTRAADVVFPVAPVTDRSGTFVNWEGRVRPFGKVLHNPSSLPDLRVLAGIAEELETGLAQGLGFRTTEQVWSEMTQVGPWDGERPTMSSASETFAGARPSTIEDGEIRLASWKQSIDDGRMQDGDEAMRLTARKPVVLVGPATIEALGATAGEVVTLTGPLGSLDLPIGVADLAEGTVWAPASAPGASVRHRVGPAGSPVSITTIVGGDQ